jgi:hypothetical protein
MPNGIVPLFIVGSPRSGTTFLCSVPNAHPLIQLTNECRIFALLKDTLDVGSNRPDLLIRACHDRFSSFSRRTLGAWIERIYREELAMAAPIWEDKHSSYADSTVLSGRTGSIERLPRSGSCLRLIRELCRKPVSFTFIAIPATLPIRCCTSSGAGLSKMEYESGSNTLARSSNFLKRSRQTLS